MKERGDAMNVAEKVWLDGRVGVNAVAVFRHSAEEGKDGDSVGLENVTGEV